VHIVLDAQLLDGGATYRNAGLSRYLRTLLRGFAEVHGHDRVTALVAAGIADGMRTWLEAIDLSPRVVDTHIPPNAPIARLLWEQCELPRAARRLRADVLHGPAHALPLWAPCPQVVTIHDLASLRYPRSYHPARRRYQEQIVRSSVATAARIVAISESTRQELIALLGLAPERVVVIPPAVEPEFLPPADPETVRAFRFARGLPEQYVLSLGTLEPRKNVMGLLEAYARLRGLDSAAPSLVIAGARGWHAPALHERARVLGLERFVCFPGYVPHEEQALWYAAARLFVYPSLYEGFGLPILEAMACGTPVLTSDRPGTRDAAGMGSPVLADGQHPLAAALVNPSDVESLAQAMRYILSDGAMRGRMVTRGRAWASEFTLRRQAMAHLRLYEEVGKTAGRQVKKATGR
jgi:glycosyltransferase involved in cell wall biosynthesis